MWIVMTASAHMPSSCMGRYRKIALVELMCSWDFNAGTLPQMIDERSKKIHRVVQMGNHNVGKTAKCAYHRTLAEAERRVQELNNAHPMATDDLLMSWGGSA
jgi:hypothetical protein